MFSTLTGISPKIFYHTLATLGECLLVVHPVYIVVGYLDQIIIGSCSQYVFWVTLWSPGMKRIPIFLNTDNPPREKLLCDRPHKVIVSS